MTFGSLFSGCGGMDLGLERAGMTCKFQVEIDPFARRILAKHWPDVRRHDDVKTFPPTNPEDWQVDLIAGGFPCQDISYAGKGAGLEGDRSGLWYEFARVVRDLHPRFVLVENVAALLVRGLDAVLGTLASFGYDAEWSCFSACSLGAPHTRDRLFIVAYTSGLMGLQGLGVGRHAKGQEALQRDLLRQRRIAWLDSLVRTSGVSDGIPRGLDSPGGRLNAHESCIAKARTAGLPGTSSLSRMRSDTRSSATSPGSSVCHICGVPLSILPYHRRPSIWEVGTWQEEAKGVHCLRRGVHELFAHQGENMREGLPVGSWQEECKQTMAHRADRIERLGNAVPPAMSEWIGRRILESVDI